MGQKILILGESGSGKSTSLRNFASDEIKLIKVINKNLPFRGSFEETVVSDNASSIVDEIKKTNKKVIVIDDAQYIMSNEYFRRAKETGWDKYNDIGSNFFKVLNVVDSLPDDVFVYYLAHTQVSDDGREKMKTIGKMLDEKLTIEGLFTVVLKSTCCDGVYNFQTQSSGRDTCKSPIGMFKNYLIDNDLKMVDSIIREYWGYSNEIVEEIAVAENAPTLKNPKPIIIKKEKIKEAPVIKPSKENLKKKLMEEVNVKIQPKEDENGTEEKENESLPVKEVEKESESPKDNKKVSLEDIKARLAAMKAKQQGE